MLLSEPTLAMVLVVCIANDRLSFHNTIASRLVIVAEVLDRTSTATMDIRGLGEQRRAAHAAW